MLRAIKSFFEKQHSFIMATPAIIWQVLFLWIPLLFLITRSFFILDTHGIARLTFGHYHHFFNAAHTFIIARSLILAFITAFICLFIAYPVAYYIAMRVQTYKTTLLFLLTLPFWVNFLIHVYAWFFVLDRNGLLNAFLLKLGLISSPLMILNSSAAIYIVMIHGYLPFMVMPLFSALEKFNTQLLEASSDLGAASWQTFMRITLPMTSAGIRSGLLFIFVASFGEYAIPSLLGGGKKMYVGQLITDYFLQARAPAVGAAFTVFSSAILLIGVLVIMSFFVRTYKSSAQG